MFKKIGYIVIIIVLLLFLQPSLFKGLLNLDKETFTISEDDSVSINRGYDEASVAYAEGYSETDFGDEFTSPDEGKFIVKPEEEPVGPWKDLLELKFSINYDEEVDDVIFKPKFTPKIKAYENKIIEVEGFIIPYEIASNSMGDLNDDGQKFMFSAFPLASCFFCGGAGAESVMEVSPKDPIEYTTKKIKIKGRLELNETDYLKLPYLIKNVELIY